MRRGLSRPSSKSPPSRDGQDRTSCILPNFPTDYRVSRIRFNRPAGPRAFIAGLRVSRLRCGSFVAASVIAAIAGVLLAGTLGAVDPSSSGSYLLAPFTAAFLGTTTIQLGRFNVIGTLVGLYLLAIGITGLQLLGANGWVSDVFNGAALIIAVAFARLFELRSGRIRQRRSGRRNPDLHPLLPATSGATTPEPSAAQFTQSSGGAPGDLQADECLVSDLEAGSALLEKRGRTLFGVRRSEDVLGDRRLEDERTLELHAAHSDLLRGLYRKRTVCAEHTGDFEGTIEQKFGRHHLVDEFPTSRARSAPSGRPVSRISIATAHGIWRTRRVSAPPAGMRPHRTSLELNVACGAAMRMSVPRNISMPPPMHRPLTAQTIGLNTSEKKRFVSSGAIWRRPPPVSRPIVSSRSAPAQKAFSPAPVRMATRRPSSWLKASNATSMPCIMGRTLIERVECAPVGRW